MKKQIKLLLLLTLSCVLMALLCVLASAAATIEGADDAYYKVTNADGGVIGYHNTLQTAIDAVTNGGTIYVEKDVPAETQVTITASNGIDFSIVGGSGTGAGATRATITMTGGAPSTTTMKNVKDNYGTKKMILVQCGGTGVTNGNITLQNVTFASDNRWYDFIHVTGNGDNVADKASLITLDNVQMSFASCYGIWLYQAAELVIEGEDTLLENTSSITDCTTSTLNNILRTNGGADKSSITVKAGKLVGTVIIQSSGTYAFSNCTVDSAARLHTSAQSFSLDGVTWNGSITLSSGSDTVSIKNSTLNPDSTFVTGGAVLELDVAPAGITLTDTAVVLSGEGRALVNSAAYAAKITVSGLTATVSGGAVLPTPELAGSFSGTKLTVTDTYSGSFLLDFSGDYEVATKADVIALIKNSTTYAAYEIADGWHAVTLNNSDLTVTLSGDAAEQQNTAPFVSLLEGELVGVAPAYEVTDGGGALIGYYSTLQAAINAVTEGGTVKLLKDSLDEVGGVELNPNGVSYVLDGAGYSIKFVSAATYTATSTSYQYLLWYTSTKSSESIELRDVTLLLDSGVTGLDMLLRTSGDNYGKAATAATLTLDNVVCEISSSYGIWLYETNHLTIKGENTKIVNNGGNIWRTNPSAKNSHITVEAGVITGKSVVSGGAVTTYLKGGTVTVTEGMDFGSTSATGYGNTVYLQGATVNGDITFSNTSKLATNSAYLYNKFTMTAGTLNGSIVVNASALKATVSIEGGSIKATGSYAIHVAAPECSVTLKDVSIETPKTVFYAESGSDGTTLTINSGSYTCYRLLYIYSVVAVNIEDGIFTACATKAQDDAGTVYFMQYAVGGATLDISGGSFVINEYTDYILGCYSKSTGGPRIVNITGGSFEGGKSWIFINQSTTLTIDGASFSDPDAMLIEGGAIRVRNNGTETPVSVTVKSGSFTIPEETHTSLFWLDEETVTIDGGDYDIYRLFKVVNDSSGGAITVNGGTFKISSSKVFQCYSAGKNKFDITLNGGLFIIKGDNAVFINCRDSLYAAHAVLKSLTVNNVSILSKASNTILWDEVRMDATAPATITYANELYYTYFKTTATDETLDVATADDTYKGASVFVSPTSDTTGIRFITALSDSVIATLKEKKAAGATLSFGTVIAPAEYVTAAGAFTVDALGDLIVAGNQYVDIPVKNSFRDEDGDGIPESYSAALVNLKAKNYTRVFAAISYVKIDGEIHYGSYNLEDNARSIEEVAKGLLASGSYEETQLPLLKTYAGFTPLQEYIVNVGFGAGRVDATSKAIVSADGYVVSDVIHLAKAGTVLTFCDSDGSFAGSDTYVLSRWEADGSALHEPYVCYAGDSTELVTTVEGVRYYTYVSSHDNEYVRLSYSGSGTDTTVSLRTSARRGTLLQNATAYAEYVRTAFLLDSKRETYHEELEGLSIVAIAPSTLDNKAIKGNLWIDLLAEKYNMTLDNHSVSGSTIANDQRELPTNHSDYVAGGGTKRAVNSFVERLSNPNAKKGFSQTPNYDVQIVYFCGGGNDLTRGIGFGEISLDNTDTETLCGAINFCIAKIKELFPNALILSETTTPSSLSYTFDFNEGEEPFTMTRIENYKIVAQILAMHGVASYDLMNEEVTGTNIASEAFREQYYMDPADVKHMNIEGMKLLMPLMDDFIATEYKKFLASKQ